MIKRIELTNFMSHEHSVFELAEGLTVLVGPNNCGKSAVVTALQILCNNDSSSYVLRHGAKECSVLIETDDGHVIRWSRKKTGSPQYEIDGQLYDRLGRGKGNVPEQLHEVLRLPRVKSDKEEFDVHFGTQRSPVFLLNDSPRAAADFFASSSDAIRLVEMQALHRKKSSDASSQQKAAEREMAEIASQIKSLEPIDDVSEKLESVEARWREIQQSEVGVEHLRILIQSFIRLERDLTQLDRQHAGLKSLAEPPAVEDLRPLETWIRQFLTTKQNKTHATSVSDAMQSLEQPPGFADVSTLDELIRQTGVIQRRLESIENTERTLQPLPGKIEPVDEAGLDRVVESLAELMSADSQLQRELADADSQLRSTRDLLEAWAEANPGCPTCGQPVTVEQLIANGGHRHGNI